MNYLLTKKEKPKLEVLQLLFFVSLNGNKKNMQTTGNKKIKVKNYVLILINKYMYIVL